jgi:hypothetical protein
MGSRSFILAANLPLTTAVGTGAPPRPYVAILRRGLLGLAAGVLAGCASDAAPRNYPPQAAARGYYPPQSVPDYPTRPVRPDYPPQDPARGYYPPQSVPPDYPLRPLPPDYPQQPVSPDYPPQSGARGYYPPQSAPPDYPPPSVPYDYAPQRPAPTSSLPPPGPIQR